MIFVNSKGEALLNDRIDDIIDLIKAKGKTVRLFTNGYLLGRSEYMKIANSCDEVVGEIKGLSEEDFQKLQRPIEGYTLAEYISNMATLEAILRNLYSKLPSSRVVAMIRDQLIS